MLSWGLGWVVEINYKEHDGTFEVVEICLDNDVVLPLYLFCKTYRTIGLPKGIFIIYKSYSKKYDLKYIKLIIVLINLGKVF